MGVIVLNWKDKRGYTLVELIISMAILSVVGGAIILLMQSGTRSYSNTKAELDLQMESQTLMAQLNTMIMESNCVKYDDTNNALILYQVYTKKLPKELLNGSSTAAPSASAPAVSADPAATAQPEATAGQTADPSASAAASADPASSETPTDSKYKELKVVTDLKIIKFDGHKLYLEEHNSDADLPAERPEGLNCKEEELLSDYINDFKAEIKGSNVTVSFEMKSGKKTYKIDETTKIRNGLVVYP